MKKVLAVLLVVALIVSLSGVVVSAKPDKAGRPEKLEQIVFVHPVAPDKPGKPDKPPGKPPEDEESPKDNDAYALWGGYLAETIQYKVNPNVSLTTGGDVVAALELAADAWDGVTPAAELFDYAGDTQNSWYALDGENTVSWVKFIPRDYIAFASMWYDPATLAIYEVDIVFNTFHKWGIDPVKEDKDKIRAFDVQNIATHEFGHPVGLDDIYDEVCSELTMYGYSSKGETKKCSLENGDRLGAQEVYE